MIRGHPQTTLTAFWKFQIPPPNPYPLWTIMFCGNRQSLLCSWFVNGLFENDLNVKKKILYDVVVNR